MIAARDHASAVRNAFRVRRNAKTTTRTFQDPPLADTSTRRRRGDELMAATVRSALPDHEFGPPPDNARDLSDIDKLRLLAAWFDQRDDQAGVPEAEREVQADLRRISDRLVHQQLDIDLMRTFITKCADPGTHPDPAEISAEAAAILAATHPDT